jgi:Chlorophyll A-B binding protein
MLGVQFPLLVSDSLDDFTDIIRFHRFSFSPLFLLNSVGQAQIIGTIFLTEIITEAQKNHYTKGGKMPTVVFPPIDFSGVDAASLKTKQSRELNNGRLAMIAIMSFVAAANVPGSVPLLEGNPMF